MGQSYAQAFHVYPDTQLVALVDSNTARGAAACERFELEATSHYRTVEEMLASDATPEIVSIVTPGKYFKAAVIACAACPSVRAIQVEKPMGGPLEDADEMVEACAAAGIVFAGGNMQVAYPEVQEMAARLASGEFGQIIAANVQGWSSSEYLGGGCQHIAVLGALTGQTVVEVIAWANPGPGIELPGYGAVDATDGSGGDPSREPAADGSDSVFMHAHLRLSGGLSCPCFGNAVSHSGVEVCTASHRVRWDWAPPSLYELVGGSEWAPVSVEYSPYEWAEFGYLTGAIRSMIAALDLDSPSDAQLAVSGSDVRAALEVATAAHHSAIGGSVPVQLPLVDRVSNPLYPRPYRWLGGDARPTLLNGGLGDATPQSAHELRTIEIRGYRPRSRL